VTKLRLRRIFWIGAATILVVAALVAVAAIVRGRFTDTDGRILLTLGALLYAGGTALAGLALTDRGLARALGRTVALAAPICFLLIAQAVWSSGFDEGNRTADRLAWSAAIALLAGLLATTALLFARSRRLVALAFVAAALGAVTATLSIVAIWTSPGSDAYPKLVGVLLIVTVLCYFLVPVLQRFVSAEPAAGDLRVLGVLDTVELVAARDDVDGVLIDAPRRGERLVLRRRA
jgi:hypothetical protein